MLARKREAPKHTSTGQPPSGQRSLSLLPRPKLLSDFYQVFTFPHPSPLHLIRHWRLLILDGASKKHTSQCSGAHLDKVPAPHPWPAPASQSLRYVPDTHVARQDRQRHHPDLPASKTCWAQINEDRGQDLELFWSCGKRQWDVCGVCRLQVVPQAKVEKRQGGQRS